MSDYKILLFTALVSFLICTDIFGQTSELSKKNKRISLLASIQYTSNWASYECCLAKISGKYGLGGELRYRFGKEENGIKTEVGLIYHILHFHETGDIHLSSFSKTRHHLLILPYYVGGDIGKKMYYNVNFALEGALKSKSSHFHSGTLQNKSTEKHKFIKNIGIGTGVNLGYNFLIEKQQSFFIEGFFKAHSIFNYLKTNTDDYYIDIHRVNPYSIGFNGGIRF